MMDQLLNLATKHLVLVDQIPNIRSEYRTKLPAAGTGYLTENGIVYPNGYRINKNRQARRRYPVHLYTFYLIVDYDFKYCSILNPCSLFSNAGFVPLEFFSAQISGKKECLYSRSVPINHCTQRGDRCKRRTITPFREHLFKGPSKGTVSQNGFFLLFY